jgi:hypothetical protein
MVDFINESIGGKLKASKDGTYKIVLIKPGQGSKAYYPEDVLRADGPMAFPAGTHSYVGHPKAGEERNPDDAIGVLTEAAHYEDGLGLVSRLKPFEHVRLKFEELAPHMGMSIHSAVKFTQENVGGEIKRIAKRLVPFVANTVDLVSYAGAGGMVVMESLLTNTEDNSQTEFADENNKKEMQKMAFEDEVKTSLSDLSAKLTAFLDESKAEREARIAKDADAVDEAADVEKALAAQKAVFEAEGLTKTVSESLLAGIVKGNYDVEDRIAAFTAMREEILAESKPENDDKQRQFTDESANFGYSGANKGELDLAVKGW